MKIINKKVVDLIPYVNNARTHSDEQITQIAASIKEFGFANPINVLLIVKFQLTALLQRDMCKHYQYNKTGSKVVAVINM